MKALEEWRYNSTHSLTSALGGGEWSASRPGRFTPRERAPGTHWIGGWMGPRAVVDALQILISVLYVGLHEYTFNLDESYKWRHFSFAFSI
jgi:hypothetical protein